MTTAELNELMLTDLLEKAEAERDKLRAELAAKMGEVVSVPAELVQQQGEGGCP